MNTTRKWVVILALPLALAKETSASQDIVPVKEAEPHFNADGAAITARVQLEIQAQAQAQAMAARVAFDGARVAQSGPLEFTTGKAFDPSGVPDAHVTLVVWHSAHPNLAAFTSTGGEYSVQWQCLPQRNEDEPFGATLIGRDPARNLVSVEDLPPATTNLDSHLRPGCTISGSVRDPSGAPVTEAEIDLYLTLDQQGGILCRTSCDESGRFSINALPQVGDFRLVVRSRIYGVMRAPAVKFAGAKSNQVILPLMQFTVHDMIVAGTLVGRDDSPLRDVVVVLGGADQPGDTAKTDANGHFSFKHVAEGSASLSVRLTAADGSSSSSSAMSVRSGDMDVLFKVQTPRPSGRVGQVIRFASPGNADWR